MEDSQGFEANFKPVTRNIPRNPVDMGEEQNRPDAAMPLTILSLLVDEMACCDVLHSHWSTDKNFKKARKELRGYIEEAQAVLRKLASIQDSRESYLSRLATLCRLLDHLVCCDVFDSSWTTDKHYEKAQKQLSANIDEAYALLEKLAPTRDLRELYVHAMKK
jgi:hypothetical protein